MMASPFELRFNAPVCYALGMRRKAKTRRISGFARIHGEKIRSRRAQIRARMRGEHYEGFCLAKYVDPEVLRRPLNLSRVKVPSDRQARAGNQDQT